MSAAAKTYSLPQAEKIALALAEALGDACERIEIAGSIRRRRPLVHDVELVAIPRYQSLAPPPPAQGALFAASGLGPDRLLNLVWQRIEDLGRETIQPIKPGSPEIEMDLRWGEKRLEGSRYFRLWLPRTGLRCDLFLASPPTWGAIYTIRTGSAEFAQAMVSHVRRTTGGRCHEGLIYSAGGDVIPSYEERDFFAGCGVRWVEPHRRTGAGDLVGV